MADERFGDGRLLAVAEMAGVAPGMTMAIACWLAPSSRNCRWYRVSSASTLFLHTRHTPHPYHHHREHAFPNIYQTDATIYPKYWTCDESVDMGAVAARHSSRS